MRVGFKIQVSNELKEDKKLLAELVGTEYRRQNKALIRKSIRVMSWDLRSGYDGDDFMQNMTTMLFTGKGYKIPRIIKKMLLK